MRRPRRWIKHLLTATLGVALSACAAPVFGQATGPAAPPGQPPLGDPLGPGNGPGGPGAPANQGNPNEPQPPRVGSPYWNADLPAADLRAVPQARFNATAARWAYYNAQDRLGDAVRDQQIAFETSPDYQKAVAEERDAYRAYRAARERVLRPFQDDPNYMAIVQLQSELERQLLEEHGQRYPDAGRIRALSQVKLDYSLQNRKAEVAALENDGELKSARNRLIEAAGRLTSLRQSFAAKVRTDPEIRQTRDDIANLRVARLATQAYYESTVIARNLALDYAYYSRLVDRYSSPYSGIGYNPYYGPSPYSNYGYYGWGFGYGPGVHVRYGPQ
jgi:hypothetical protein